MIFPFGEVVLKPYDFSDILFAINCRRQYHLNEVQIPLRSNITRRRRIKLPKCPLEHLGPHGFFVFKVIFLQICKVFNLGFGKRVGGTGGAGTSAG